MENSPESTPEPSEKAPNTPAGQPARRSVSGSPRQDESKHRRSPIRVLYLQGFEGFSPKVDKHILVDAVGAENVLVPDLHTKRTIIVFALVAVVLVLLMGGAVLAAFITKSFVSGLLSLLGMILVGLICFVLGGRGVTHLVLKQAVASADTAFAAFRPNVIVASAFGAVVCFQMDIPKVPLLLLAPAQDQYYRYMHLRPYISITDYPYVIVVHGSLDETVPLDDSIRLVETCEVGRCRLEVVDDDHKLSSLTATDFERWIEEAYDKGKEVVLKQSAAGSKNVDPSLFGETDNDVTSTI